MRTLLGFNWDGGYGGQTTHVKVGVSQWPLLPSHSPSAPVQAAPGCFLSWHTPIPPVVATQ
jgi:hypothetical protein